MVVFTSQDIVGQGFTAPWLWKTPLRTWLLPSVTVGNICFENWKYCENNALTWLLILTPVSCLPLSPSTLHGQSYAGNQVHRQELQQGEVVLPSGQETLPLHLQPEWPRGGEEGHQCQRHHLRLPGCPPSCVAGEGQGWWFPFLLLYIEFHPPVLHLEFHTWLHHLHSLLLYV